MQVLIGVDTLLITLAVSAILGGVATLRLVSKFNNKKKKEPPNE